MTETQYLQQLVERHKALALAIAREFPQADEETLLDTIEGASELPALLAAVLRSRFEDLSLAEALRGRLGAMRARLERIESRAEQKRVLVASAMQEAELRKLLEPDFTASLRPSPSRLVVIDEMLIPQEFWRPQPPRLDRQILLAALKLGRSIPGAELADSELILSVRCR